MHENCDGSCGGRHHIRRLGDDLYHWDLFFQNFLDQFIHLTTLFVMDPSISWCGGMELEFVIPPSPSTTAIMNLHDDNSSSISVMHVGNSTTIGTFFGPLFFFFFRALIYIESQHFSRETFCLSFGWFLFVWIQVFLILATWLLHLPEEVPDHRPPRGDLIHAYVV